MKIWPDCNIDETDAKDEQVRAIVDSILYQRRLGLSCHCEVPCGSVGLHHGKD